MIIAPSLASAVSSKVNSRLHPRRFAAIFAGFAGLLAMTVGSGSAQAEVRLPKVLGDHMVLQRNAPIHIWGWSDPGEAVTVEFDTERAAAVGDGLGHWSVYLPPHKAGGPFEVTIRGSNNTVLSDVMVGDLWIASGQSNMEMPLDGFPGNAVLKDAAREIANSDQPRIRLLNLPHVSSDHPLNDISATWTTCTTETARRLSAVAYFFGREIQDDQKVTVGLVDATWGGTPAEAWTSLDGLAKDANLMPVFSVRAEFLNEQADLPMILAKEKRDDDEAKAGGKPAPQHSWHPDPASFAPAGLYNAMIAPLTPLTIKGVIWYQGETNSGLNRAPLYDQLFPRMIEDWREKWHEGDFPFLFAQISSFKSSPNEAWGVLRDAQRRTLRLNNTAMAVTLDVGDPDNVHPANKQTVGHRLALAARVLAYGESVESSGPLYQRATPEGASIRVWFQHAETGLSSQGGGLEGFEVAGADHHFVPGTAKIDGSTVIVSSPSVLAPAYVRYAWPNAPVANLINSARLPASTFTSEDTLASLSLIPTSH